MAACIRNIPPIRKNGPRTGRALTVPGRWCAMRRRRPGGRVDGRDREAHEHRVRAARVQPPRARVSRHGRDRRLVRGQARHEAREDARAPGRPRPALLPRHGQRHRRHRVLLVPRRTRRREGRVAPEPFGRHGDRVDEPRRVRRSRRTLRGVPAEARRQGRRGHRDHQPLRTRSTAATSPTTTRRPTTATCSSGRCTSRTRTARRSSSRAGRRCSTRPTCGTRPRPRARPSTSDRTRSVEVEPVEVHDLVPRRHEVTHELLLRIVRMRRPRRWLGAASSNRRRGRRQWRST